VEAALRRIDRREGREPRAPAGDVYGTEQLIDDLQANRCPAHGCDFPTTERALMCRGHWRLVPADARREVMECVRRVQRVGKRYDSADAGGQDRLWRIYLEDEAAMRDAQLRAVILASERAGAR
jgi:hypothetical protein